MKFTISIQPELLESVDLDELQQEIQRSLSDATQECVFSIGSPEICTVKIELDPNHPALKHRDAETVKDIIHEGLMAFFDPEFNSDIEVELDTEL